MEKLYIVKAENAGNLTINLTFSDNTTQRVDIGDYIRRHPHPQYNKYLDPRKFSRFSIDNGHVVWGKNWDMIFPIEQLYENSQYKTDSLLRDAVSFHALPLAGTEGLPECSDQD